MKKSLLVLMLFVIPASTNYKMNASSFGGGGGVSGSTTYDMRALAGEVSGERQSGTTYDGLLGLSFVEMSHTPTAPTVSNDSSYYNKLKVIINTANNPSDTKYAIAISDDSFATTQYVQSDNTVSSVLGTEDWQSYIDWGGATGEFVVGLDANTTYSFKVSAMQGSFTQGPFGPVASVATSAITLSFDIDVSAIDEETAAPYAVAMGSLTPNSVITAADAIWVDLATNAANGGTVYVVGGSGGLYSASAGYTISGVSANLSSTAEGFGLRSDSVTQSAGGPLAAVSPYNGASDNVGQVATTANPVFTTTGAPITGARASVAVKAKAKSITPSASDYSETVTFIATANF